MYRYPNFPEHVYVELTNVCNASCTICATTTMQRKREIMRMPLFQKVVDECARYKAKKILPFLHGESLLVPGISNYFRYVRQASPDTHVNLTTNGSKLSAKLTETFLGEDLLDSIIISIDGGDKQTYEAIRKGLDYDDARQALERQFITSALSRSNGSRGRAANLVGMHRNTLSRKISGYNLKRQV